MAAASSGGGNAGAVRAGKAFVEISANDAGVKATLDKMRQRFMSFGTSIGKIGLGLGGIGTAITGPLAALSKWAINSGSAITDMSQRLGATTEELSAMTYAMELGGASAEDLEGSLRKMQKHLAESGGGGGTMTEQVEAFADQIAAMQNPAEQTAAAMEVFGKSGTKMLPFLKQGAAGMREMAAQADKDGAIWSKESADKADRLGDVISRVMTIVKSIGREIALAFLPGAEDAESFAEAVGNIGRSVREFIKNNSGLIKIIGGIGLALVAVGGALTIVGGAFIGISAVISGAVAVWGALTAVFTAIISPIGLIVAGIAAVTASVGYLLFTFTSLGEIFSTTWGGILAAVSKGDLSAAMDIAWLGIKLTWQTGIAWLEEMWINFTAGFRTVWEYAVLGITGTFAKAMELIGMDDGSMFNNLVEDSRRAVAQIEADRAAGIADANAASVATRAELDAAIARAKTVEQKMKQQANAIVRGAVTAASLTGSVSGGFGSNLAASLSIGSNRKMADDISDIRKTNAATAKALEGAGPLVWAA